MSSNTSGANADTRIFLSLLLICSVAFPEVMAADPGNGSMMITPAPELTITNYSFANVKTMRESSVMPTPVTIFRAEVTAETLPGPRYMAFGPSVIGISIDPRLLATVFAVVLIGLVIWFVSFRKHDGEETGDEKDK